MHINTKVVSIIFKASNNGRNTSCTVESANSGAVYEESCGAVEESNPVGDDGGKNEVSNVDFILCACTC